MMFSGIKRFFKRIGAIRFMMKDKGVALWKKILIVFGILYFILPFEALPDFLLPFGLADDIVLWACILFGFKDTLDKYIIIKNKNDYSNKFNDTIEDVDYEIKE